MAKTTLLGVGAVMAASLGMALMTAAPASAGLVYGPSGICPATQVGATQHSAVGSAGLGNATDCNLVITFNADGSISTSGPGGTYESVEDALIGVVNNTGHAITSFNLSNPGVDIAGFDGDGIDLYTFDDSGGLHEQNIGPAGANTDKTTYGGYNAWFSNISGSLDSLTVNFANGGIMAGHTDFFSLEEPASLSLRVTNAPEPATLTLLGMGLAGVAFGRRRRQAKK
ncbi:MAG TPA: PEP-CTERM sorting domain-containing protein [Rhizomicrobium sp.]|nr:PEP-CTERM sorting domain-containing protein [Rhizomicrobium sp.]